eukprot:403350072
MAFRRLNLQSQVIASVLLVGFLECQNKCALQGYFYNSLLDECQKCHISCEIGVCFNSTFEGCFECKNHNQLMDLDQLQCVDKCKQDAIQLVYKPFEDQNDNNYLNGISFQYCRSKEVFIDPSVPKNHVTPFQLELGTREYPYRQFDDIFREIFNSIDNQTKKQINIDKYNCISLVIYVKQETTADMYSINMPILILQTNTIIRTYTDLDQSPQKIKKAKINIIEDSYPEQRFQDQESFIFNPTVYFNGSVINYKIQEKYDQQLIDLSEATETKFKFHVYRSNLTLENLIFIQEFQREFLYEDALVKSNYNQYRWVQFIGCEFYLASSVYFTSFGVNLRVENSIIDMSKQLMTQFYNFDTCLDDDRQQGMVQPGPQHIL